MRRTTIVIRGEAATIKACQPYILLAIMQTKEMLTNRQHEKATAKPFHAVTSAGRGVPSV
jgi:hypothetical protein